MNDDNADETAMVRRGKWQFAAISRGREENSLHSNLEPCQIGSKARAVAEGGSIK